MLMSAEDSLYILDKQHPSYIRREGCYNPLTPHLAVLSRSVRGVRVTPSSRLHFCLKISREEYLFKPFLGAYIGTALRRNLLVNSTRA